MDITIWALFFAFVFMMVALDLGVFHRTPHAISTKEATLWSVLWVCLALIFTIIVYYIYEQDGSGWITQPLSHLTGKEAAVQFLTGYLIEKSLSVDNIFIIALIFAHFKVKSEYQHRVLFWGILGAVVMRGIMIALGATLMAKFWWMEYVFGAILLFSAAKLYFTKHDEVDIELSLVVKWSQKLYPLSRNRDVSSFFIIEDGRRMMTPLFLTLLMVETTDVIFALDSIPAIFAITRDPFLVFTSNIFAILGLRSLYFLLANMMQKFAHLQTSLIFVLGFVGVKMLLSHHVEISNLLSLLIITAMLGAGVGCSLLFAKKSEEEAA
jgi:tellurite resistance protein TerC